MWKLPPNARTVCIIYFPIWCHFTTVHNMEPVIRNDRNKSTKLFDYIQLFFLDISNSIKLQKLHLICLNTAFLITGINGRIYTWLKKNKCWRKNLLRPSRIRYAESFEFQVLSLSQSKTASRFVSRDFRTNTSCQGLPKKNNDACHLILIVGWCCLKARPRNQPNQFAT